MNRTFISLIITGLLSASPAWAQELKPADFTANDSKFFSPALTRKFDQPRAFIWPQTVSLLLPGFDQWYEGQYSSALAYTGTALVGSALIPADLAKDSTTDDDRGFGTRNDKFRQAQLGSQMYLNSGLLSAYQSFRTAVRSRQAQGEFLFLRHEETADDILWAPLAFGELRKPTTYVPLLIGAALGLAQISDSGRNGVLNGSDLFYSGAYSFGAGTTEEAAFRGWVMPVAHHYVGSEFWSNTATAVIFAGLHASSRNRLPWPQFAMGWYLGYLTQKNEWTLKESIFIHAWWDVIAFSTTYYINSRSNLSNAADVRLPLLNLSF